MRQMFVNKVKETELELKEKEREVRAGLGSCGEARAWLSGRTALPRPGPHGSPGSPLPLPAPREV